uniref:Zinc finger, CCHC-type n=1 Tax=Heterorhabditis bacteriophora TaxID=37862 RepID=A0A1I7X3C3_HETBA
MHGIRDEWGHTFFIQRDLRIPYDMNTFEVVILIVGWSSAIIAHVIAWFQLLKILKILKRLNNCHENLSAASKLMEYSEITASVMQLGAERFKYDPDVNEFERNVAILMLKDPKLSYTGEIMARHHKAIPKSLKEAVKSTKSRHSLKKKKSGKTVRPKEPLDNFMKPQDPNAKVQTKDPNYQTLCGLENQEVFGDDKNPKKKFVTPIKVEKADAKDPQYETLHGIGNELFCNVGENKEKSNGKNLFKQPMKVVKADAKDPQYETLVYVKDDIFKK